MTRRDQTTESPGFASGPLTAPLGMRQGRPRLRWVLVLLVFALVATGGYGAVQTISGDADGDGLTNSVESSGWVTQDGSEHRTDPYKADTDGDGLTDGDEAART